ncbi:copper resistance protein NlpE [Hymenobacter sp. DH14]|uniref:Copper resistance protein NlpE n=1 Tax=Hymenobacter cyanobacteriorum TaxID=2926463 RepID=A0A9X1VBK4_9BACT|nr:DUF5004 domain-containing protein [Hymenobacter cyanobacteriorum]MCI1186094.1 copper resistance protein NlpE [Hymenobacter cyanobacteriorum]
MNSFRYTLLALALTTISLSSCEKDDTTVTPQPTTLTASQQITTGSWRLDQITERGQVTGTGAGIKDQYSLTFRSDGTYTQKILADNSTYPGTWMLMNNNAMLHLTDNKGASTDYMVTVLTAKELRYNFINKNGFTEERTFSAQP